MNLEHTDSPCMMSTRIPFVPLPMAMLGMMMGFMLGAMFGAIISHRRGPMMHGYGGPMMHGRMKGHHHHGDGSPACREWHGDWPPATTPPMEP